MDAAFFFAPEDPAVTRTFFGRLAANRGLYGACARFGRGDLFATVTPSAKDAQDFRQLMNDAGAAGKTLVRLVRPAVDLPRRNVGTLFRPDPNLPSAAWMRRAEDADTAFSIAGLTHTLSTMGVLRWIGDMVVAPLHPWDAMICTSRAARDVVTTVWDQWADYLADRCGAVRATLPRTPIIPLGIDTDRFDRTPDTAARRTRLRAEMGVGAEDVVILFFGRLSHYEKANPIPMILAAERAARRTTKRVHLALCGRFADPSHADLYRRSAATLAPGVGFHLLDGGDQRVADSAWWAADIFTSLSDNIQETFGLTPVEAMAAGLPVVVSDWDGYRDTIIDGGTGFLIPTWGPRPETGVGLTRDEALAPDYYRMLARISQATAVDVDGAADAYLRLIEDPALRARLGDAGRRRAREEFDWRRIVPQYESLWAELRAVREAAAAKGQGRGPSPHTPNPLAVFGSFPTALPGEDWTVSAIPEGLESLDRLLADPLATVAAPSLDPAALRGALDHLAAAGPMTAAAFQAHLAGAPVDGNHLLWLAKMGIVALSPPKARRQEDPT